VASAERAYSGTWAEFVAWFPDEAACARHLERLRWPEGIVCRACGERRGWRTAQDRWWVCAGCAVKTSVTAGTIFDKTRTPLATWFVRRLVDDQPEARPQRAGPFNARSVWAATRPHG